MTKPDIAEAVAADGVTRIYSPPVAGWPLLVAAADFNRVCGELERLRAQVVPEVPTGYRLVTDEAFYWMSKAAAANIAAAPAQQAQDIRCAACDKPATNIGGLFPSCQCGSKTFNGTAAPSLTVGERETPCAWARQQFIHDDAGYCIGTDDPELYWGDEPPEGESGWIPLYGSAGVTTRDAALEEAAKLCELWNTSPGRSLAKEIRALKGEPETQPAAQGVGELPPLPEPDYADQTAFLQAFSADKMRAYARAALAQEGCK